jgi:hypothetical protein
MLSISPLAITRASGVLCTSTAAVGGSRVVSITRTVLSPSSSSSGIVAIPVVTVVVTVVVKAGVFARSGPVVVVVVAVVVGGIVGIVGIVGRTLTGIIRIVSGVPLEQLKIYRIRAHWLKDGDGILLTQPRRYCSSH